MFNELLEIQYPRLLSQVCRDENSPFYGCFDRNWWHYRIRDFASIMLQQGGYTLFNYSKLDSFQEHANQLSNIAWGAARFWNERAGKRGAFEEYYPWEKGYPPLAFSTLSIAKLVIDGEIEADEVRSGMKKAARQLEQRFEYQAGNQQVAGLSALAAIRKIDSSLVNEKKYLSQKKLTLSLQNTEGWYTEYDGPDLGYLSVTMDCLWDLYDFTEEKDYLVSAERAFEYLYEFIVRRNGGAGMHNARNTDYIVPYGICRFLQTKNLEQRKKSLYVLHALYYDIQAKSHFFYAIDDRYWSHYIGHSVVRAQLILNGIKAEPGTEEKVSLGIPFTYAESGYIFRQLNSEDYRLLVSPKKGGIFSIYKGNSTLASDYGWLVETGKKQLVSHWWSNNWKSKESGDTIEIRGNLFPHAEKTSTPFLHFGLRIFSFFFGSTLTKYLRNILIFKSKTSDYQFKRVIEIDSEKVIVTDEIKGRGVAYKTVRAPRASKRHVASADSWHFEEFNPVTQSGCTEKIKLSKDIIIIETIFILETIDKSTAIKTK